MGVNFHPRWRPSQRLQRRMDHANPGNHESKASLDGTSSSSKSVWSTWATISKSVHKGVERYGKLRVDDSRKSNKATVHAIEHHLKTSKFGTMILQWEWMGRVYFGGVIKPELVQFGDPLPAAAEGAWKGAATRTVVQAVWSCTGSLSNRALHVLPCLTSKMQGTGKKDFF